MTKVVNIRFDKYDVYCGRAGKGQDGYFGNRHVIGFCKICGDFHNRYQCIDAFRLDFYERIKEDAEYKRRVLELKGKTLGCFCKQRELEVPCHCDVYVEYLEK